MRLLVDTHILLWQMLGDARLRGKLRQPLIDTSVTIIVSDMSLWEVAIKVQCGKLRLSVGAFDAHITAQGYDRMSIARRHVSAVASIPRHHGDPFDHLLIAQSLVEDIPILTADKKFAAYDVALV